MCVEWREGGESSMHCLGILKALMWLTEGPARTARNDGDRGKQRESVCFKQCVY